VPDDGTGIIAAAACRDQLAPALICDRNMCALSKPLLSNENAGRRVPLGTKSAAGLGQNKQCLALDRAWHLAKKEQIVIPVDSPVRASYGSEQLVPIKHFRGSTVTLEAGNGGQACKRRSWRGTGYVQALLRRSGRMIMSEALRLRPTWNMPAFRHRRDICRLRLTLFCADMQVTR
jgi:hypothetical protein